jgi:hypothetical protein
VTVPGAARMILAGGGLLVALAASADAEHEIFYRYIVVGYVKDARGAPVSGTQVELIRNKTGFSYLGETGPDGFFLIIARLGDESAGERLTLRVGQGAASITARFDPSNHADHRGTRVDFQSGTFQENSASFASTLARFLGADTR